MRWIDIPLPPHGTCQETDRLLDEAQAMVASIPDLQERHGLDASAVTQIMEQVGKTLFQAVTADNAEAFHPDLDRDGCQTPDASNNALVGYHIVADSQQIGLPWHWLHNGVAPLLEKHPVTVAEHGSRVPELDPPRIWMQRHSNALFADDQESHLDRDRPEILFVPGHGREEIRRLMFREAEGIDEALDSAVTGLARLRIPGAVTPGLLASRAMLYQALHFAAPTSQPPEISGAGENRWLAGLMAGAGAGAGVADAETVDNLVGLDMEILGVDPVEAALDQAMESYVNRPASVPKTVVATAQNAWLLEDGPVLPENLGRDSCLPPLVFSNSWCSLGWLGRRFLDAGASTFVGTAVPLFSRPARRFAAHFYGALGDGYCAGVAHQRAALSLRDQLGMDHPAWLCHGVQGFGSLRLADL